MNPTTSRPERIGPYRITGQLGRGGMGVVHLGVHVESAARAAVKTVLVPEGGHLASFRREIHALARLRHPGIVRIVDHGIAPSGPWYAMEVVDGRQLREHVALARATAEATHRIGDSAGLPDASDAPTESLATVEPGARDTIDARHLERIVTLVARLCPALAYLHGEGLVHRDLKPGNVLVAPGEVPVLVDFGLAEAFASERGREALAPGNEVSGTVSYMAPEQAAGRFVDARADLYALGCILYELLTGRPPFVGDVWSVLRQHRDVVPDRVAQHVEGVPAALAELVARLLEKDPLRRVGYADDVARALASLGARPLEQELPFARPYVYRAAVCGREEAGKELRDRMRRAAAGGAGGVVIVEGESGVGKTRLVAEAAGDAMREGVAVVASTCENPAIRAPRPLEALAPFLRFVAERCRREGTAETARLLGHRGRVLAEYEPSLATLPGLPSEPAPSALEGAAGRERVVAYLLETLVQTAAALPLLIAIDDVPWADDLSLDVLRHAAADGRLRACRALLIATSRTEDEPAGRRALPGDRLVLGRLAPAAVAAMTREMLALGSPMPELESFLALQSGGNPLFVAEYLKAAIGQGHLRRDAGGAFHLAGSASLASLELPRNIAELLDGRLARLDAIAADVLEIAAVIGRHVDVELLSRVSAGAAHPGDAEVGLQRLIAGQVLEERQGCLGFVHDRMREAAYARLDDERRRAIHRRVAVALEAAGAITDDRGDFGAALATHWHRAGEGARARPLYLAAAGAAHRRHALDVAETLTREGLALFETPTPHSVAVRNALGRLILQVQGKPGQREQHTRALAEARAIGDARGEAESLNDLGYVLTREGRREDARASFEASLAVATAAGDTLHMALASGSLAVVLVDLGRLDAAALALERAAALFRLAGDRRGEALMLTNHGYQQQTRGDLPAAEASYRSGLAVAKEIDDSRVAGYAMSDLGTLLAEQGESAEAGRLQEEAFALARQVGDRDLEATILANLGDLRSDGGDPAGALPFLEESERLLRDMGALSRVASTRTRKAAAIAALGRLDEAASMLEEALATLRPTASPLLGGIALGQLADVERRRGSLERAADLAGESARLLSEAGAPRRLLATLCVQGHIALARGVDGTVHLEQARHLAATTGCREGSRLAELVETLAKACDTDSLR